MKRMEGIAICGAVSLFIVLGLFLMGLGAKNIWRAFASNHWPAVDGIVRVADIVAEGELTSAEITVEYAVRGATYTTSTLHFGQTLGSGDSSEAQIRALRYAKGRKLPVRYDPRDPAIACTEAGFHTDALWLPGAGLGFGLPGVMFLLFYLSSVRTSSSFPMLKIGLSMFALIFGLGGAAMLSAGLHRLWNAHASLQWPQADAEIVYANEDASTTYDRSHGRRGVARTSYATNLVYRYEVNGRTHYSNLRRIGQLAGSSAEWADEIAEQYPQGKKMKVRYHPSNPDLAVIEPGITDESYWLPGAGGAVLLFALLVALFGIPALTREF